MKKVIAIFLTSFSLFSTLMVSAESHSYTYNYWNQVVSSPNGYIAKKTIDGTSLGIGSFVQPSDIYVDHDNLIYISDTGNNRIVCLYQDYSVAWILDTLYEDTNEIKLTAPKGLFVDDDKNIYICLDESALVVKCDKNGKVLMKYTAPQSSLLSDTFEFKPSHVLVSESGTLYALSDGFYLGALLYNSQGEFLTFFGSNDVKVTPKMVSDKILRKFMTEAQKNKLARYVPVQYDNFDIDNSGFIYTCTKSTDSQEVRRLNTLSENVLQYQGNMGDLQSTYIMGSVEDTRLVDLCVDDNGFISALDENRGRIFQYDREGNLMMIFGGSGDGLGLFVSPCSIDSAEDKLLVLDKELASITVFEISDFGKMLQQGNILFQSGLYTEAENIWSQVLDVDVNNELAYNGLGKAFHAEGKYKEAMECFKKGNSREEYSESFKAYRSIMVKKYFPIVIPVIFVLIALLKFLNFLSKKHCKGERKKILPQNLRSILRVLNHPTDECEDIKYKNTWNIPAATFIILLLFLSIVASQQLTAFIFNKNNPDDFNILTVLFATFGGFLLYVCVNWAVTTLIAGKGKMKEIYCASSYALLPYIFTSFLSVICSRFMILDEKAFIVLLQMVGLIWSVIIMISVLRVIHEYSFTKVFVSLFLTACGMAFIIFIIMLFVSLIEQLISFIQSIYQELLYRR